MNQSIIRFSLAIALLTTAASCKKWYNAPEEKPFLSENINYSSKTFSPVVGRTALLGTFNADNSTFPLDFQITNIRNQNGSASSAFEQKALVKIWKEPYTGTETSLAEIEAKRAFEERNLFEVRPSGEFIIWNTTDNANFYKSGSDSSYIFDVKVSGGGGSRVIRDLTLMPMRERPYEPSNHINAYTGAERKEPLGSQGAMRLLPNSLQGMRGEATNRTLVRETRGTITLTQDCWVYFERKGDGNSLTFKFMNKDSVEINPDKFNGTKWDKLLHGFNMTKTTSYVRYDVAYPIPLTRLPTPYTTADGSQANVVFSYNRIGLSGNREVGSMNLAFNIFREGDWEIIFFFHNETPRFDNE